MYWKYAKGVLNPDLGARRDVPEEVMSKLKWRYPGKGSLEGTGCIRENQGTSVGLENDV